MDKMTIIENIKGYINARYENMTNDEFNCLAHGCGLLSIVDEGIAKYDEANMLTETDINELTEYSDTKYQEYLSKNGKTSYMIQIASNLAETIQQLFTSTDATSIGRFKFQLDVLFEAADTEKDEVTLQHCNNYYALLLEVMIKYGLNEDDVHDYKVSYIEWLQDTAEHIYQMFAENCMSKSEYDDHDEFIEWLNHHDLTFFEMQYIDMQFDEDLRKQYELDWYERRQYQIEQGLREIRSRLDAIEAKLSKF